MNIDDLNAEYVANPTITLKELAEKHGISYPKLLKSFKTLGITLKRGRRKGFTLTPEQLAARREQRSAAALASRMQRLLKIYGAEAVASAFNELMKETETDE